MARGTANGHRFSVRDVLRRAVRCRRGAVALEFAFLVPMFLILLYGVASVAMVLFTYVGMENAAREAARRMAVAEAAGSGTDVACGSGVSTTTGTAEWYACQYVARFVGGYTVNARDLCPLREMVVTVSTDASNAALLDVLGFFKGGTLNARVFMRRESDCPPAA